MTRSDTNQKLTVCYFGTYRANYSRNQIMIAGLRAAGVEVLECYVPLWKGIEDRVEIASGKWFSFNFVRRVFSVYKQLLTNYMSLRTKYDVMVLGYPGQLDVFLARLLTWFQRKPLVLDFFMSIYLVAIERGIEEKNRVSVRLLRLLESVGCRLPDLLICDTRAYVAWHHKVHGLPLDRFRLVPTGVDDRVFKPLSDTRKTSDNQFRVLYYGTYIPNHGVETIIEAANILKEYPTIRFELIGDGPMRSTAQKLAQTYGLNNVIFTGWVEKQRLPLKLAAADLLLGAFGTTPQSTMTIQNKIYEGLATKKPLITGDSPTMRDTFQHKKHLYLIERANPTALAEAISTLQSKPELRTQLAEEGYRKVINEFTIEALGQCFRSYLENNNERSEFKNGR